MQAPSNRRCWRKVVETTKGPPTPFQCVQSQAKFPSVTCCSNAPPPPCCGVHYLWFAFVCFLIRSHPPLLWVGAQPTAVGGSLTAAGGCTTIVCCEQATFGWWPPAAATVAFRTRQKTGVPRRMCPTRGPMHRHAVSWRALSNCSEGLGLVFVTDLPTPFRMRSTHAL